MSKRGDIYIPGSPDYMVKAVNDGVVDVHQNVEIIAYLVPAILVQKGNPKNIRGLCDLSKEGLRVAIGDPESVCVGLYAYEILEKEGILNDVKRNIVTLGGSCSRTAALIPMKAVDAIMGWRVFAKWNPETTDVIFLKPDQMPRLAYIPAAISTFSEHPKEAKQFIEFLKCPKGQQIFTKWGYLSTEKAARKFAPGASIGGEYKLPADYVSPVGK
ncbi:MAG: substrate-binding domain-containing protein, partial [bacterium]